MIPAGAREPLPLWGVRVWEEEAPEGEEALEWILLTSLETSTLEQAWERVNYYGHRWVVEDYLKSPQNRLPHRRAAAPKRLMRLLGLLSPIAVRLLQLRDLSRTQPDRPAHEVIEPQTVAVLAARTGLSPSTMTVGRFWTEVARLGGAPFSARRWPTRLEDPMERMAPLANPA